MCDTVHDGVIMMIGDDVDDQDDADDYDDAGQSVDVIWTLSPYNWK